MPMILNSVKSSTMVSKVSEVGISNTRAEIPMLTATETRALLLKPPLSWALRTSRPNHVTTVARRNLQLSCPDHKLAVQEYLHGRKTSVRMVSNKPTSSLTCALSTVYLGCPWMQLGLIPFRIIDSGPEIHMVGTHDFLLNCSPCYLSDSLAGPSKTALVGKGTMRVSLS